MTFGGSSKHKHQVIVHHPKGDVFMNAGVFGVLESVLKLELLSAEALLRLQGMLFKPIFHGREVSPMTRPCAVHFCLWEVNQASQTPPVMVGHGCDPSTDGGPCPSPKKVQQSLIAPSEVTQLPQCSGAVY